MIILILEGMDSVGKTTMLNMIRQTTKYEICVLDRFLGSDFVYDKIYGRKDRDKEIIEFENKLSTIADVHLVYLYCSDSVEHKKRLTEKGDLDKLNHMKMAKKCFAWYFNMTNFKKMKIDTYKNNKEEVFKKILEFVKYDTSN